MTKEDEQREPRAARVCSGSLQQGLAVLSQFDDERTVLSQSDIAQLTGFSCSTSQRCLMTLSALGYLAPSADRCYRLASVSNRTPARPEDDMPDTLA